MKATASVHLDTRISKGNEIYPVKIRITFDRIRRYYGIDSKMVNDMLKEYGVQKFIYDGLGNYATNREIFEKALNPNAKGAYKYLGGIFKKIEFEYQEKADSIKPFSFDIFAIEKNNKKQINNVFEMMDRKIKELESEERIGSASCYESTKKSLQEFVGRDSIPFEYFTPTKIKKYEYWMKSKGRSVTTIGIYLRTFRAIFNEVKKSGLTDHYPFGGDGYKIPKGSGRKIALDSDELSKIMAYKFSNTNDTGIYYFDIWKMTYYLNGINIKDLVLLKESNIIGKFIHFTREKTKNTVKEDSEIRIYFSDEIKQIIDKWRIENKEGYILPVFKKKETEKEIKRVVNNLIRSINQTLKKISKELKINKNVSCYTARHSWATQMMRHGAPVSFIGKQLGHRNTSTTDDYLKSFDDETIIEWQQKLTGIVNEKK